MNNKYNIGDRVVYAGVIGIVLSFSDYGDGRIGYGLEAELDSEITCTAMEHEIEFYTGEEELDQENILSQARLNGQLMMIQIDGITDKYIGDCSF